ncbi:MAG: hypothetical protein ACYC92_12100, partial [Candidatus Acidiferrales bacterium]
ILSRRCASNVWHGQDKDASRRINSLLKKCSWPPFLPLRGNRSLQKPKENADSSSRLLVGMTTNRVFQQAVKEQVFQFGAALADALLLLYGPHLR